MLLLCNKYAKKHKHIVLILLVISILSIPLSFMLRQPHYKAFSKGLAKKMKNEADIPAIRIWLNTTKSKYKDSEYIDESDWPSAVKDLSPVWIKFDNINDEYQICLRWGGGFSQWGIVIGSEDMEIPPSNFEEHGEYRLPIAPGVYVWHEI